MKYRKKILGLRYFIATAVFFSVSNKIFGQYFLHVHINSKNGLPQNTINDIAFDKNGFAWFATEDGMVRYDGLHCKIYNSNNSGLKTNRTEQFIKTANGDLYCTMDESDLYRINEHFPKINIQFIRHLALYETTKFQIPKPKKIDDIVEYNKLKLPTLGYYNYCNFQYFPIVTKELIFKRYSNGILRLNSNYQIMDSVKVKKVWLDDYSIIQEELIGFYYSKGFFTITNQIQNLKTNISIPNYGKDSRLIWDEKESKSYFYNQNTLYSVQLKGQQLILDTLIKNIIIDNITDICMSANQNQIIIGTLTDGVYIYNKVKINTIKSAIGDNNYYAQAYSNTLKTFILTFPIQILSSTSDKIYNLQTNGFKFSSYLENDSVLWSQNNDSLYKYYVNKNMKAEKIYNFEGNRNGISIIAKKNDTSFYVITNSTIYLKNRHQDFIKLGKIPYNNKYKRNYTFLQDSDSLLWIASHFGLHKFNLRSNTISNTYFKDTIVRALLKTTNGSLLIGTYGNGWYVLKNDKLTKMPMDKGKSAQVVHTFLQDSYDKIWFTTNNGLFNITSKNISDYINDTTAPLYYYKYSETDGLLSAEFNGGCHPTHVEISPNNWSLPSNQGLVQLDAAKLVNEIDSNAIFIDEILLDDKPINHFTDKLDLPKHNFKLQIYISTAYWSDRNNLSIDYQINNNKERSQWIPIEDLKNPIIIQNLKGGTYKLIIRKRNIGATKEFQYSEISIIVPKILSEQTWFYPLVILCLLLFAYIVSKLATISSRRRKEKLKLLVNQKTKEIQQANIALEKKNKEISIKNEALEDEAKIKKTLIHLLGHDVATPLRFIHLFLDTKNENELSTEDILDVKISVKNIQILLDNLMAWLRKIESQHWQPIITDVDINALINTKLKLFELIIRKRNITVNFKEIETSFLQTDKIICSIAIQNILGNAINNSKNEAIAISCYRSPDKFELIVENNGRFKDETINNINLDIDNQSSDETLSGYGIGLKITKELLKLINGKIFISNTNKGAKSIITIYE